MMGDFISIKVFTCLIELGKDLRLENEQKVYEGMGI